jgi:uncharacterized protein with ATP-grasp and redox domains
MEIYPECVVCLFRLALRAARAATADMEQQREVLARLAAEIPGLHATSISPEVGRRVQQIVRDVTGDSDPFRDARRQSNEIVLARYERLERRVASAEDPLLEALRLAVAGNVIDLAVGSDYNLERAIDESVLRGFAVFDYGPLLNALEHAGNVLYLGDNAGEIVFDRLLVERLTGRGIDVTFAVRGGAAINDAIVEDARQAGLADRVEVIDTGSDLPTVLLRETSVEFRDRYRRADLVISKGQGNFEGLCEEPGPLAFLLMAKCEPVARLLGVERGSLVLRCRGLRPVEGRA